MKEFGTASDRLFRRADLEFFELEPRIVFDAAAGAILADLAYDNDDGQTDGDGALVDDPDDDSGEQPTATNTQTSVVEQTTSRTEIIFVDARVRDLDTLLSAIDPSAEIVLLDADRDGVEQIAEVMAEKAGVDAVHILAHGTAGQILLGSGILNAATMDAVYSAHLVNIGMSLSADADILIYGCDFGAGEVGATALSKLANLTGADLAGSDDTTGHSDLGGDWDLERHVGDVGTSAVLTQNSLSDWVHILAATSFQEGTSGYTGTQDTELNAASPATNFGSATTLFVDDGTPNDKNILIRFDGIFGSGTNLIPYGATINYAELRVFVSSDDPADTVEIYRMLTNWSEASTFNSLVGGVSRDNVEARSLATDSLDAGLGGTQVFVITSDVQAWSTGAANYGWLIATGPSSADNWGISSSENATIGARPLLYVDYTPPQPPSLTPSGTSATYIEDGAPQPIDSGLLLSDVDSANLSGATVRITNFVPGQDLLGFSAQNGISGTWNNSNGTLTLSGSASIAHYQAALRSVTYENTSDSPDTMLRSIEFVANDGYLSSTAKTVSVAITSVNDAPSGSPVIVGTAAENQTLTADTSSITDADGLGAFSYQWYRDTGSGPVAIGGATGSTYTLGDSDVGAVMSVAVSYVDARGTSEGPLTSSSTSTVTNVNDMPTITNNGGGAVALISVDENQMLVTQITATDVDSSSFTYQIVGGLDAGLFKLDISTGVLSFVIPPQFKAPTDADGNNYYEVIIQVSDGHGGLAQQQIIALVTGDAGHHLATDQTFIPPPETNQAALDEKLLAEGEPILVQAPVTQPRVPDFLSAGRPADVLGLPGSQQGAGSSERYGDTNPAQLFNEVALAGEFGLTGIGLSTLTPKFQISLDLSDLNEDELWRSMSEASEGLLKQEQFMGMEVRNLTIGSSIALSAGVVAWALRGGALATALMASVPTLSFFNPMLIVIARRNRDGEQDVVGDMFSRPSANSTQGMSA